MWSACEDLPVDDHEDDSGHLADSAVIRRAEIRDASLLAALVDETYRKYVERIGRAPGPMDLDYGEVIETRSVWVAELNGSIVGVVVLSFEPDHVLLENVAVREDLQGIGLGAHLIDFAEQEGRRRNLPEMRLYTNEAMTENLVYYPRLGFHETGRAASDGFQRVWFTKSL